MTPQEQQMIDGLIARIRSTQITDRDPVVADHLQQGLGANPDALYILAQTVLVQQHSLEQAHAQMDQLEQQLNAARGSSVPTIDAQPQPAASGSWLSRFFGVDTAGNPQQPSTAYSQQQASATGQSYSAPSTPYQPVNNAPPPNYNAPVYPPQPNYAQQGYAQPGYAPQGYAPPGYAQQGYASPFGQPMGVGGGGGSFLRTAVQTAAGVAAGEMLFQGIESMFSGGHRGYGSNFGGGAETINNYYEGGGSAEHHHPSADDSSFYNPSNDASRNNFADAPSGNQLTESQEDTLDDNSYTADDGSSSDDDASSYDDSSDDSSFDDSSSDNS